MVAYLDCSVILGHILVGETAVKHALACPTVVTSELTEIECRRVVHRYRMNRDLDDQGVITAAARLTDVTAGCTVLALSEAVKKTRNGRLSGNREDP